MNLEPWFIGTQRYIALMSSQADVLYFGLLGLNSSLFPSILTPATSNVLGVGGRAGGGEGLVHQRPPLASPDAQEDKTLSLPETERNQKLT